jgi:hypothetical protein
MLMLLAWFDPTTTQLVSLQFQLVKKTANRPRLRPSNQNVRCMYSGKKKLDSTAIDHTV